MIYLQRGLFLQYILTSDNDTQLHKLKRIRNCKILSPEGNIHITSLRPTAQKSLQKGRNHNVIVRDTGYKERIFFSKLHA